MKRICVDRRSQRSRPRDPAERSFNTLGFMFKPQHGMECAAQSLLPPKDVFRERPHGDSDYLVKGRMVSRWLIQISQQFVKLSAYFRHRVRRNLSSLGTLAQLRHLPHVASPLSVAAPPRVSERIVPQTMIPPTINPSWKSIAATGTTALNIS